MTDIRNSDGLRAAIAQYQADVIERTGRPPYRPFVEARQALAESVDGLNLTPREWQTLRWFLDWDNVDALASIITKARRATS